jgi:pimeloyl-ACP methyl ester carboxylesterase
LQEPCFLQLTRERRLAYQHTAGKHPGVLFCGGYTSDMTGTKATALETFCRNQGRAFTRFDYRGHWRASLRRRPAA